MSGLHECRPGGSCPVCNAVDDGYCPNCDCEPCECDYCPDCKTVNGCNCDAIFEEYRDRQRGL